MSADDITFEALKKTDRCCRLILKQLRESHAFILEGPEFEKLMKQTRRQLRENRELLGTAPAADRSG
jgi:hypothetical protein